MVSYQLELKDKVKQYLAKNVFEQDSNYNFYFEKFVLAPVKNDIVLALDNIDCLSRDNQVFENFLMLLHSWHQKSQTQQHWSKLKLILTYSTKTHIPSDVDRSPFNAGVPILLEEFNSKQVATLANLYQLGWGQTEIDRLMNEIGGHPYLLRLAMYQAKNQNATSNYF